ncbi:hypothetical protein BTR14_22130 [Rhizobium rhizosphaerae]|uniref:Glycosyl transferase family 1 domain-containing protein n=1 Tax=Xaviernesmea rhizosphaerae TaxID=1672749 RepID=A0ABX3P8E1_9HYPH|nr:glycosyltransferase family 1 protein [Xaviernesmea rhizosphaerae]OQP83611.1 hypothetical protein BTR14_22130 [Xaviernesmea rhizosphaerae]
MVIDAAKSLPIFVNGRFLGRPVTGVERFARSILAAVDAMIDDTDAARWTILVPPGVPHDQGFAKLKIRTVSPFSRGHLWEQTTLSWASRKGLLFSPCNSGPVLHPRHLVVIHDALVFRFPEGFSPSYARLHRTLGRLLARRAHLATVSAFSRSELSSVLHQPAEDIAVLPNAVDHLDGTQADPSVLDRYGLEKGSYFLFVGSPAPNKNLGRAIEAYASLKRPDLPFVLVGKAARVFSQEKSGAAPEGLLPTGRLSDAEIKALYQNALALIFPSIYEGFGIPPLEAMSLGCPALCSDIPVMREICGNAAAYFKPLDQASIAQTMAEMADGRIDADRLRAAGYERKAAFSWEASAHLLLARLDAIAAPSRTDGVQ